MSCPPLPAQLDVREWDGERVVNGDDAAMLELMRAAVDHHFAD
jgi:hypothetical protein